MLFGNGCDSVGLVKTLKRLTLEFTKNPELKRKHNDLDAVVEHVFTEVFGLEREYLDAVKLTPGNVRIFKNRLDKYKKNILRGKLIGRFGDVFYNTSAKAKRDPVLSSLTNKLADINHNFRGRTARHNNSFKGILENLRDEIMVQNFAGDGVYSRARASRALNKAVKEASKFNDMVEKAVMDASNHVPGAIEKLMRIRKQEDDFYKKGEGKVFYDFIDILKNKLPALEESVEREYRRKKAKLIDAGDEQGIRALKKRTAKSLFHTITPSERIQNALIEYVDLMDDMHRTLSNGVEAYIKTITATYDGDPEVIKGLEKNLRDKLLPSKIAGFYPQYRRVKALDFLDNLMPHMQRVSDAFSTNFKKNDHKSIDEAISAMSGYLSGHAKLRTEIKLDSGSLKEEFDKNFLVSVKRYIDEVDKFNMIAHTDRYTREALIEAKRLYKQGKPLDGFGKDIVQTVVDLNNAMKGNYGIKNERLRSILDSLLALEFTSKLGFNVRTAIRNAIQGLLNFVEYGPVVWTKSAKFYRENPKFRSVVDRMTEEAGILFDEAPVELIESARAEKSLTRKVRIIKGMEIDISKPSKFTTINRGIRKLAGKSGYLMRKIENVNRRTTFRIAFYKMYNELNNSREFKGILREKGMSEDQIDKEIITRSRNYAIRGGVGLLHFDYEAFAKSKALRSTPGSIFGQFQHYASKFLEYNMNLASNAKDDVMAKQLTGENAMKAYRMGMAYFLAPALVSAMFDINAGSLIQHNTVDKLKQLWALFTGDDDEIEKAFYGKGPLVGFMGGPLLSDIISFGNLMEVRNMDKESLAALITGYQDYANVSKDRKAYETIRILNSMAGRTIYSTIPQMIKGNIGFAVQSELGLYRKEDMRNRFKTAGSVAIPSEVLDALEKLRNEASSHVKGGRKVRLQYNKGKQKKSKRKSFI